MDNEKNMTVNKKTVESVIPRHEFTPYLGFCLILCCFGSAFQIGLNLGMFNTPVKVMRQFYNETYHSSNSKYMSASKWDALWGLTNSLAPLGSIAGSLVSGILANKIGRKYALFITNILVLIAGWLTISSKSLESYYPLIVGRFISGVHFGLFYGIGTMYCSEIAPKNLRGAIGSFFQMFQSSGVVFSNFFGLPIIFGNTELWPLIAGVTFIPAFVLFACFPFCAETPKYAYINLDDQAKAEQILRKLRGTGDEQAINQELLELEGEKRLSVALTSKFSYKELFNTKDNQRALLIACVIAISYHFSGMNMMTMYSTKMFIGMGFEASTWAVYATILVNLLKAISILPCILLVDRVGRRKLLITGYIGMSVACFGLALLPLAGSERFIVKFMIVTAAAIYVLFFGIGPGPITWLIVGELFPSESRGHATSIAIAANSLAGFIVTISIPPILEAIDEYIFIIFAVYLWFCVGFVYLKLPETKKKTIEEISRTFKD